MDPALPRPASERTTVLHSGPPPGTAAGLMPSSIERYEILRTVADGRGGMGVVYEARDTQLQRTVALKLMTGGATAPPLERKRFLVEAEAAARLSHPNVMPVYDFGESDEGPWFVMPLVEGGSLARRVAAGPTPTRDAVALMLPVCDAVAHAHQQGILHRDLKPANIMLTAGGTPIVADFGLAKRLGDYTQLTATGTVMGTPSYMPPEQALGLPVNEQADVFSLGAVLYALVTGRPPALGNTPVETLRQVIEELPPRPSTLAPGIDPALNLIILTCLEKSTAHRYATARALADDLQRWQREEAISVRKTPPHRALWKWARRKPAQATAAGIALTGVLAFITLLIINQFRLQKERDLTDTVRQSAENLVGTALTDYRQTVESTVGKLDALDQITTSVDAYFTKLPPALQDARVRALQTQLLTLRGEVFRSQGKLAEAVDVVDRALALAEAEPSHPSAALRAAAALVARTDLALRQDDPAAPTYAARALTSASTALTQDPSNTEALRQRGLARFFQARCAYKAGQSAAARQDLDLSIADAAAVSAADPANLQKTREHAWALVEQARVLKNLALGQLADQKNRPASPDKSSTTPPAALLQTALTHYTAAKNLLTPLLTTQPWNHPLRRDLCVIHDGLGDLALNATPPDPATAAAHYQEYLQDATVLTTHDPRNTEWLREQAAAHRALASALTSLQKTAEADQHMDAGLTVRQQLIAIDPSDAKLRRDYCNALIERGDARLVRKKNDPAHNETVRTDYDTADQLARETLTTQTGPEAEWWESKRVGLLARRGMTTPDPPAATALLQEALALAAKIKTTREDPTAQKSAAMAQRALSKLQSPP